MKLVLSSRKEQEEEEKKKKNSFQLTMGHGTSQAERDYRQAVVQQDLAQRELLERYEYEKSLDEAIERVRQEASAARRANYDFVDQSVKSTAQGLLGRPSAGGFSFSAASKQQNEQQRRADEYTSTRPQFTVQKPTTEIGEWSSADDLLKWNEEQQKTRVSAEQKEKEKADYSKWRDERDALIDRYVTAYERAEDQMRNESRAATPDSYLDAMQEWQDASKAVDAAGGIENLRNLQLEDAEKDRVYKAKLAGMDLDRMTFWDKAATALGGTVSGALKSYGASMLGQYQNAQSGNILNTVESDIDDALRLAAKQYLGSVSASSGRGSDYSQSLRDNIYKTAEAVGGADYAQRVMDYIDDQATKADPLMGFDLSTIKRDEDETYKKLFALTQSGTGESLLDVEKLFELQNSATEDLERAKNAMGELGGLGDFVVDAGSSAIQSGIDAAITKGLGLGGAGAVAMIPFGMRAAGGAWAEGAQKIQNRGEEIGRDMAKNLNRYAGQSGAIEMATELLWGSVGAESKVTGGGAFDEYTTKKVVGALQRMSATETGAKILGRLGEKVVGGAFEGLEEVIGDVANYLLDTAGIIGEEREALSLKDQITSFVTGAMSGLFGEVTGAVSGRMQDAQIGRNIRSELKAGDTSYLDSIAAAASQYKGDLQDTFDKIVDKRDIYLDDDSISFADQADKMSNVDLGRLAQAFEEQTQGDDYDDIERAVKRLEKGKDLTERDVARIVRNEAVTDYLAERSGVEISEESKSADAIEALKALASQREASKSAREENVQEEVENAVESDSEARTGLNRDLRYTRSEEEVVRAMAERAQPLSAAESIRAQTGEEARAGKFGVQAVQKLLPVENALERLGINEIAREDIVNAYNPNQDAVEYAGEMTRFYNLGVEGRELDTDTMAETTTITPAQARIAYTAGRAEYNMNVEEGYGTETEADGLRLRDGVQGENGQSPVGQSAGVEKASGSAEFREEIAGFRGGRQVKGVFSEPVSAADLGIAGGSQSKSIRIIKESNDAHFQESKKIAESTGCNFVGFVGGSLVVDNVASRGFYDPVTNTIYARMDHAVIVGEQITKHEAMHHMIRKGQVDLSSVKKSMVKEMGQEKALDMIADYAALYEGLGMSEEEIFEELVCDSYGNMNEFVYRGHWEDAAKNAEGFKAAKKAAESVRTEGNTETQSGGWKRYSADRAYDSETAGIKAQIANSSEELNAMQPVASIMVPANIKTNREAAEWAISLLKNTGYQIDRQGYGKIVFREKDIRNGARYATNNAERAAFAAVPSVLKRGIEIGRHNDHKARSVQTITFAAPVVLNGTRGNMAVVINSQGNHYKTHRIIMPDGTMFVLSDGQKKEDLQRSRGVAENSSLAETTRPSTDKIAEDNKAVKQILEELGDSGEYNSEAGGKMSRETDPEILKKLNSGKTMTVYRSMQMIDGKLFPPMAAKVKGKMVDAAELGTWYVSDERPDAINRIDDRGIGWFTLNKANGDSLEAAYNPYWHTSNLMINDQFTSAYKRGNLVTVECEIPVSELSSGYRAEYAKDPVGETDWHKGPVAGKLAKTGTPRTVYLSRWVKVNRVVSDAEVAKNIAGYLEGTNITVPVNTVTPGLRSELEKLGVPMSKVSGKIAEADKVRLNRSLEGGKHSRELGSYLQETHAEYKTDKENLRIAEQGVKDLLDGLERISAAGGEVDLGKQGRDGKTDIRTLGNGISARFIKTGRVNLNGTRIRNAEDLAQLCQIFRNPRFETVRYFYVKKGRIVGTDSVTCRLPGLSLTYGEDFHQTDLIKKIKRVGADGVYLMHNHPSGNVTASRDDYNATGWMAETVQKNTDAKLLGHIIIDHRVFTELQADTKNRTVSSEEKEIPGQQDFDFLLMPSQEYRNLGKAVFSPETVAAVGRDIVSGKGYSAIVYASTKGQVRQIQEVSDKTLLNNKQLANYIRNQRVNVGAGMAFVYTQNDEVYKAMGTAYVNDILTDVILDRPEMLLDMRSGTRKREGMYMGLKVSEKDAVHANEEQTPYSGVESKYDRYLLPDSELTQEEIKAKKDYRTYLMPEAKEWYSKSERFEHWAHRDLAYISAASVAGAKIPYKILKDIPEIVEAEARARRSGSASATISDSEQESLVARLFDNEHGSATWDEKKNKIKKDANGNELFQGPVANNSEAFIVIGRPAGGKSRVFANPLSNKYSARIIDSDVVKPWIDGFDDGYGAGFVQKASAQTAEKALEEAIKRGENIVIPRVGGSSILRTASNLKKRGYRVSLYFNEVSEETSLMRAASRFAEEGRFLSLDYLTSIGEKATKTFIENAENGELFDHSEWRSNDVEFGKEPIEIFNSDRTGKSVRRVWEERMAREMGYAGPVDKESFGRGGIRISASGSEGGLRTMEEGESGSNQVKSSRELRTSELYDANRQLRKDLTQLRQQLKTRTAQKEYWKGQTKVTEGRRVRLDDAKKLARAIASEYGTKVDADVVGAKMKDLAEFCLNEREFDDEFYGEARTKAYEIAHMILDNAEILRDEGDPASYEKLRDYLRTTKLYVPGNMQHDLAEDYQAFRKSLLGTVTLTTSDTSATGIDVAYKELQGIFGEGLFPDIAHPADQLKRMLEILESFRPIYERMNSYEMAEAVEWTANDILGRVVGEEIRQTDPTYADKMEARLKAEREKAKAALKLVRQKRDQQVEALKQHYRQVAEDKRAKRIDSEARTRLLNIARRLNNKKLDRATRALLDKYIGDLDLVSKGLTGKSIHDLQGLQTWYEAYKDKMGEDFIPIKSIEDRLKRLSQKHIKDMTQEEVADLTTILLHLENEIRTASKLIESQEKRDIYAAGMEVIDDIRGTRGKKGTLGKYIVTETLTPVREIRRLTGYREHDPLYTATKELADGQRKMLDYQRRAEALVKKWTEDKAFVKRIAGKNAQEITVQGLVNGELTEVKITPAMRMALYLHGKNDGNMKHISNGGVKIPDMTLYKKGKMQEAYDQGTRVVFTRGMINKIASQMAEDERAFADTVSWYYNNMSRGEINETSELLKGFSIAGVDYYYPIDTDGNFLKKEFDAIKRDGSIEGMGFLKERIDNPTNPIMLYDMNDTLNKSISQHSKYVGLAIPVRNFNKLYGVSTFSEREVDYEADPFDRQDWQYDTSVAETIRKQWGAEAAKYIEKMMTDIQNGTGLDRDVWGSALAKARSKYAGAVLNTNASVAFKQTASYPTAAAVVGYVPLMKALKNSNRRVDLEKVEKLTALLWYRMKGFSNVELGDIGKGKYQIPKALNWIQAMDVWTTRKLWLAAEYYVETNNKDLKRGTEAFDLATAEVYNRIIEETQPNYTMMQRPQILRSESDLTRALNMFKTQPFQNFNILYDAIGNLRAQERYYKANATEENLKALKEARKCAARAISSQIISAFVFSLMQFAWDAFRGKTKKYKDDDEDEMTLLSWLKGMGINVLSSVGGMIPFGGYALELGESMVDGIVKALGGDPFFNQTFYGMSENASESMNDMGKAVLSITSQIAELFAGNKIDESAIRKFVDSASDIAQFAGVPVSNWIKLAQATAQNVFKVSDGEYLGGYKALRVTTDPSKYKSDYYALLKKAWMNDPEAFTEIRQNMINMAGDPFATSSQTAEQNIDAKVKEWAKEKQSGANNDTFYNRVYDGITGTSLWASASAEAQGKALDQLLSMALAETDPGYDKNGAKKLEKARGGASVGLDETEYTLFLLAMSMANPDGGNIKNSELEEAINMIPGLTPEEQSYLWGSEKGNHANDPYLTPNVTRGGSMTPELAPTSNAPAWYHPKKYHEPSGQAGDVVKRGDGLNENPYMLSMTGRPTRARIDFESKLGGDVYRKLWSMAQEQNAIYDVYNTMEYIASDRQDQLYGRGNTDSPVERLTAALAYMHDYEQDPAKKKLITKLYEILADGVENGDLSRKDSELNKLLWKLGF